MKKYYRKRAKMNTHARTHVHLPVYKKVKIGLTETLTRIKENKY